MFAFNETHGDEANALTISKKSNKNVKTKNVEGSQ
jgi:hypothetical protein